MRRFNNRSIKKSRTFHILAMLALVLTIGYAAYAATLKIRGTFGIIPTNVSVVWSNIQVSDGSVTGTQEIDSETSTEVSVTATLEKPGDFHEFTVVATNNGDVDAMVSAVNSKLYLVNGENEEEATLPNYLDYSFTYSDGKKIAKNHLLAKTESETYLVRIEVKKDISASQLPDNNYQYRFEFSVDYSFADKKAVEVLHPSSFKTDSWETIAQNAKEGSVYKYNVGDTKEIYLLGDTTPHIIRIANNTTPNVCKSEVFSQSACGFVIEFADIISTHRMNPYDDSGNSNGDGNKGGWEYSEAREYLNSDIYNLLPYQLRDVIINTTVVSGHGSSDTDNFTTTDKLYLLSRKEVWNYTGYNDTAQGVTRQLDYYNQKGVTPTNYANAIKQNNGSYSLWWLRTSDIDNNYYFDNVYSDGAISNNYSYYEYGISPAFRIG